MAARQQDDMPAGERFQRFDHGVGVGGLGIIVIRNAVNRRHVLDTVLHALKSKQSLPHLCRGHSRKKAAGNGSQHIFFVVGAKYLELVLMADFLHRVFPPDEKSAVFHIYAFRQSRFPAKITQSTFGVFSPGADFRIVIVQDRNLFRRLVDEDVPFAAAILLHGLMPFHVIRRQIQDRRHIRSEIPDAFQLVAGNFRGHPAVLIQSLYLSGKGQTDISPYRRFHRQRLQHFAYKSRSRGFPVGPGDSCHVSVIIAPGQLDLPDDLHAVRAGFLQNRKVIRYRRR